MARGRRKAVRYTAADTDPQMSLMPEHDWDFVDTAVERVLHAWDAHHMMKPDAPMLLAFSGGKDSVCLYHICRKASEKAGIPFEEMFHAQYNITNLDPPELVRFVRKNYPDVHMHHPVKTIWQLIVEKHMPPMRNTRYCCKELKEISQIKGGFSLTGVRHAESPRRALRGGYEIVGHQLKDRILLNDNDGRRLIEHCSLKSAHTCNPIIDWSDEDVWRFIRHERLPYCCLYDEGWHRLGCIGCPLSADEERERSFKRWPGYERQYVRTFQRMLDAISAWVSDGGGDRQTFRLQLPFWTGRMYLTGGCTDLPS